MHANNLFQKVVRTVNTFKILHSDLRKISIDQAQRLCFMLMVNGTPPRVIIHHGGPGKTVPVIATRQIH